MEIRYTTALPTAESIYELYGHLDWNGFLQLDQHQLMQAMEQSWCVVAAYHGDRLVGTGRIISDGVINGYLCGLGVHKDYRKQGIGTAITHSLIAQGKKHHLHLQFFCESHLVPYYEKMNFEVFAVGMKDKQD
ncbi:MAG: GNAT family N-acetyltransferase [Chitinophaga sp.]|uniref:GNAT family N-acetyltransferase n=1 Tax=Chitinophaga sp. TaxID=1869181 RepID=UPI001B05FB59|nr:GNAT family N-acetyltransferase [Chitinophaga sp.]MBO9728542.1 GNAT family N-acetyltransferase [Chitinophaga sp.]